MYNQENIGEKLKAFRKSKKLSVPYISKVLGIPKDRIYKWEKGHRPTDLDDYKKVESFLNDGSEIAGNLIYEPDYGYSKKHRQADASIFDEYMKVKYLPVHAQPGYIFSFKNVGNHADKELDTLLVPKEFEKGSFLVIEVGGNSMDDGSKKSICEGDKILLKELEASLWRKERLLYKDLLFVLVTKSDGVLIRQITKHDTKKNIIACHPWNSMFQQQQIAISEVYRLFYIKKIIERKITL